MLNNSDFLFVIFMEFINDEPRRYGPRVGIHVENEERATHREHLYDNKRTQPIEIMVDPDKLIPILRRILILRLPPQIHIQTNISPSPFKPFLGNMRKHLRIHLHLVDLACTISIG